METDSRREALGVLKKFVHGEISAGELLQYVRRRDLLLIDELLDRLQLRTTDFAVLSLDGRELIQRLDEFLQGRIRFREFSDWVRQLFRIHASTEYQSSDFYNPKVEHAFMVLALFTDPELTGSVRRSKELIRSVRASLARRHELPMELLFRKLFKGKQRMHLVTRAAGENPEQPWVENQWAELAMVGRLQPVGGADDEQEGWFVPLSVSTRTLWLADPPAAAWAHPENDKVLALRDRYPELGLERLRAQYFVDPDGLAELVMDVRQLRRAELAAAVRLFCLRNEVHNCSLDGRTVRVLEEDR